jgi:Holliday junction resolvase
MRAARVDQNQSSIVQALREAGATVQLLHKVGQGCPDIVAGYMKRNYMLEVKLPDTDLNELQVKWHRNWFGQVAVVRSAEEALIAIGATK